MKIKQLMDTLDAAANLYESVDKQDIAQDLKVLRGSLAGAERLSVDDLVDRVARKKSGLGSGELQS